MTKCDSSKKSSSETDPCGGVLVTGGAGYVGSHVTLALLEAGREVVVVDDLSTGFRRLVDDRAELVVADVADRRTVARVIAEHGIEAVVHCAGSTSVPESIARPLQYYRNNVTKARALIETCVEAHVEHFVFSSSAAVYGQPDTVPVAECAPTEPINPYGRSKLMVEWMLRDAAQAHRLNYLALRYFNVAGADPQTRCGQATPDSPHLMRVAVQTALGLRDELRIFGTDYPTDDGTCVRDFIHVCDLADIHVEAVDYLFYGGDDRVLNCGYGRGFSVRQVVEAVRRVSGSDFRVVDDDPRPGDPTVMFADPGALEQLFEWTPDYNDLERIVADALAFERHWQTVGAEQPAQV